MSESELKLEVDRLRKELQDREMLELARLEGIAARLNHQAVTESPHARRRHALHEAWMQGWLKQDAELAKVQRTIALENVMQQLVEELQVVPCAVCGSRMHTDGCTVIRAQELLVERVSTNETFDEEELDIAC